MIDPLRVARGALFPILIICSLSAQSHSSTVEARGPAAPGAEDALLASGLNLTASGSAEARRQLEAARAGARRASTVETLVIDYPLNDSIFPPEIVAPRLLWHDPVAAADRWLIEIALDGGRAHVWALTPGPPAPAGEIDPRCLGPTNEIYKPTAYQASARSWQPDEALWAIVKRRSTRQPATLTILGVSSSAPGTILSRGRATLSTSRDAVGAPIFYRDVPLMPSQGEKNVIKPLSDLALPLIAWRLRDISRRDSRVVLHNMPTCANCHSFSADGKRLGMDMDGPDGDKGAYAIAPIQPQMRITRDQIISWNSFAGKPETQRTIGFLSQLSPDGQYAVTTLNEEVYVANFTDYRFLQVFYPTRGILGYYSAKTDEMKALPGADDTAYVHCDPVWSPDGQSIVLARARASDSYVSGVSLATRPNDPHETPMRYDLYRMPFNDGRGGTPVPIAGASDNGLSNTFPKVTPDGRFIVFVKSANGQLLRPDSELWIVPFGGGEARRLRCNTALMNSWHSFNPSGRWMVFSSKANTPYTQMFLTHLDESGESSPPILIPDATAANRAVNIPEFVNTAYDNLQAIEAPSVEHYRYFNEALAQLKAERWPEAIATLEQALALEPKSAKSRLLLGTALWRAGRQEEALGQYEQAVALDPGRVEAHYSLSFTLFLMERQAEGIAAFKRGFGVAPRWGQLPEQFDLGVALALPGPPQLVLDTCHERLARRPDDVLALVLLASLRAASPDPALRNGEEALRAARQACTATRYQIPEPLDVLAAAYAEAGRSEEAVRIGEFALWFARAAGRTKLVPGLEARLELYRQGRPFRRAD